MPSWMVPGQSVKVVHVLAGKRVTVAIGDSRGEYFFWNRFCEGQPDFCEGQPEGERWEKVKAVTLVML